MQIICTNKKMMVFVSSIGGNQNLDEHIVTLPSKKTSTSFNPLTPVSISKQLEMIGRSAYILAFSIVTALHSDINQTAGSGGHLSM